MQTLKKEIEKREEAKKQVFTIKRIIPKAYQRELLLVKYVTIVSQSKNASKIIQTLKQYENVDEKDQKEDINPYRRQRQKQFLKRVRKLQNNKIQVLVCRDNEADKEQIMEKIAHLNVIQEIKQQELPKNAPLTKKQFEEWAKFWPINFIQQQISRQIVHSQRDINIFKNMKYNIEQYADDFYLLDGKTLKILYKYSGQCKEGTINHPIMKLLKQWPQSQIYNENPNKYYYLTGLKMFIRKQLCGMCSMALVHSRLFSIYMTFKSTQVMDSIMSCPRLNHEIIMFILL